MPENRYTWMCWPPYLIEQANFVACHQFSFLERIDVLKYAEPGGTFLLNSPFEPEQLWDNLPREVQEAILAKHLHLYVIDAQKVSQQNGMAGRINTIMQTCFFALSGVLPREQAIAKIKDSIRKSYSKRGEGVIQQNFQAVEQTLVHLHEVEIPSHANSTLSQRPTVAAQAPSFVRRVIGPMLAFEGDSLPVSVMPVDGTYPSGTTQWEKRNIGLEVPQWETDLCIQCGKCVMVCPHAVIRHKVYEPALLENAPDTFKSTASHFSGYAIQLASRA